MFEIGVCYRNFQRPLQTNRSSLTISKAQTTSPKGRDTHEMEFAPHPDQIGVIPLHEIAALQARLLPEQTSPSNSSDDIWSTSGNSSPSNDIATNNHEYEDEDQPLRPVFCS